MKIENPPIQKIYRLEFSEIKAGLRKATGYFPLGSH